MASQSGSGSLLTTAEAAALLGVSLSRVDQFAREGRIPVTKLVGRARLFLRADVLRFKRAERKPGYPLGKPRKA